MGSSFMATCSLVYRFFPNRSSPKFPHPIFFPTRKFGPTMRIELVPVEADRDWAILLISQWRTSVLFDCNENKVQFWVDKTFNFFSFSLLQVAKWKTVFTDTNFRHYYAITRRLNYFMSHFWLNFNFSIENTDIGLLLVLLLFSCCCHYTLVKRY